MDGTTLLVLDLVQGAAATGERLSIAGGGVGTGRPAVCAISQRTARTWVTVSAEHDWTVMLTVLELQSQ